MDKYKLRLKDPSGAEFEAEGPVDFILNEKASFLENIKTRPAAENPSPRVEETGPENPAALSGIDFWSSIIEPGSEPLRLRIKSPEIGATEAALILMAANRAINQNEDLGAMTLSRALKTSGYEPDRLDRMLSKEVKDGKVTASGTKRNRTYHITRKGLEKTYKAINRLHKDSRQ